MKTILAKINDVVNEEECITDVGEIISMTEWWMDDYSGSALLTTSEGKHKINFKPNAVLGFGAVGFDDGKPGPNHCCDPRVIMMYLWRERQRIFNEPETDPPVPTREEAIAWMKKRDIPLEPQAQARDWTPKMKRNFLNIKD